MKKIVYFLFLFFIVIHVVVAKDINVKNKIISIPRDNGWGLQGFSVCNDNLVFLLINSNDTKAIINVYDLNSNTIIKKIDYGNLGHANDITCNNNENKLYVAESSGSTFIHIFDSNTFEFLEKKNIGSPIRSIAYLNDKNIFAIRTVSNGYFMNSDLSEISKLPFIMGMNFNIDIGRQGWDYYDGNIYYANWSWKRYGGDGANIIYVYDTHGNRIDTLYTSNGIGELEDISFYKNKMILGFNSYSKSIDFYSEDIVPLEVIKKEKDNKTDMKKDSFNYYFLAVPLVILIAIIIIFKYKKKCN